MSKDKEGPLEVISRFKERYPSSALVPGPDNLIERGTLVIAISSVLEDKLSLCVHPCEEACLWAYDYIYESWQSIIQICKYYNQNWVRFVSVNTTSPEILHFIAASTSSGVILISISLNRHTSCATLAAIVGRHRDVDIGILSHPNVDIGTLKVISDHYGGDMAKMALDRISNIEAPMFSSDWSPASCFEQLRFSDTNHLGLGDIRMTVDMQDEFCKLIEKFYIKKAGNG